jgi:hypothetical protein
MILMAAGATCIAYGPIRLLNCHTLVFDQEMVFDESGTDLLYFKFTVRVAGFLHGRAPNLGADPPYFWNPTVATFPTPTDGSAGHHHYGIRHLFAPRQVFEMRLGAFYDAVGNVYGGTPILSCAPFQSSSDFREATNKDLNNGPKVKIFNVTQVVGDTSLRVEVEFEICKLECDALGNCSNTSGVLSNRWSCIDEIDQNFYTTRTFQGKLRTVSSRINANSFRDYVVPPLQPGMRRQSMEFAVSTDGLHLEYTIVDREVAFAPPAPATSWSMSHTESATRQGELGFFSEVNVTLGGDRLCDPKLLISIAVAIAEAKILKQLNPNSAYLLDVSITHETGDDVSRIHLHAKGRRTEKNVPGVLGIAVPRLGRPIDALDLQRVVTNYDRNFSRGTRQGDHLEVDGPISLVGAFASYLQQPCSIQHKIYDGKESENPPTPTQYAPASLGGVITSEIPDDGTLGSYSDATAEAMYTFWQMESTYRVTGVNTCLPIARSMSLGGTPLAGPMAVAAKLGPPMVQRVVRVRAERVGKDPLVLNPAESFEEGGVTYSILSIKHMAGVPERTPDDKRIYRADVEIVYMLDRPPPFGTALPFGSAPWQQNGGFYEKVLQQVEEGQVG